MVAVEYIRPRTMILFDAEKSFITPLIQEFFLKHSIFPFIFEPSLHHLLNPCDNNFHAIFKLHYNREISNHSTDKITIQEKFLIAKRAIENVSEESIVSMFKRCGLLSPATNYKKLVTELVNEGIHSLEKEKKALHQNQLKCFIEWCEKNEFVDLLIDYNDTKLQISTFLEK